MEFYDAVRWVNLVLSVVLLFVCNKRLTRDWPHWTRREQVVRVHLTAYLFVIAYGTAENLAHNTQPGPRILLILLVHLSFAAALWRHRKDPPAGRRRHPADC